MTTLLIDNYDSFSYNLYQLLGTYDRVEVVRNDAITCEQVLGEDPDRIVLSPGPGRPAPRVCMIPTSTCRSKSPTRTPWSLLCTRAC